MPLYDYRCADCGDFELTRRISERDSAAVCPACGQEAGRVLLTAPAISGSTAGDSDQYEGSYGMRHRGPCSCC